MAVVVTYEHPVAGVVAPTAAEVLRASAVVAAVEADADADVLADIDHNMAISVADLAAGFPIVNIEMMLPEGWVSTPHVQAAGKLTNSLAITMANAVGSGVATDQFRVTILRPNTIIK